MLKTNTLNIYKIFHNLKVLWFVENLIYKTQRFEIKSLIFDLRKTKTIELWNYFYLFLSSF